jgi:F420-non-reducing hydrogenase iron-sulfur subunit
MMERRFGFLKEALTQLGIEPERLRLEWISAGEGEKFAALIRDTTQRIKELGPNPLRTT